MSYFGFTSAVLLGLAWTGVVQPPGKIELHVLYIGPSTTSRGKAYAEFLHQHFRHVEVTERRGFDPARAKTFDVVLLDWSQDEREGKWNERPASSLGPQQAWGKPTVLLGSAGLLQAEAWEVLGTIG